MPRAVSLACGLALALLVRADVLAAASPAPRSISASYDVFLHGAHIATMSETFEATTNGGYRLVSESAAVGVLALFRKEVVRLVSSGRLTPAGLQPLAFEGKRSDDDPRRVRGEFDWPAGRLTLEHHGRTEILPLPPGTQDRLSVMYQFMFLAPDKPRQIEISMTNGRKLDRYLYSVEPGVSVETALGRVEAVRLVRQRQPDENATEIWLSPRHRYLPVRMLIVESNGSRYEQVATRVEIRP